MRSCWLLLFVLACKAPRSSITIPPNEIPPKAPNTVIVAPEPAPTELKPCVSIVVPVTTIDPPIEEKPIPEKEEIKEPTVPLRQQDVIKSETTHKSELQHSFAIQLFGIVLAALSVFWFLFIEIPRIIRQAKHERTKPPPTSV